MNLRQQINELIVLMGKGMYEREEVIALSLLSALAGESIFLLGLPGVGKSMVARRLKSAFSNASCFEYLMSRFSTPDEIFGPVSISRLKDMDIYERNVDGYLPSADVVFLDEIWKAGPAIQNALLTALNEKIYHNGKNDLALPIKGIIAASNELPAEDEGLEALWDRFLFRYIVQPVQDKGSFFSLMDVSGGEYVIPDFIKVTDAQYELIRKDSRKIPIPDNVMEMLYKLRTSAADKFMQKTAGGDEDMDVPYVSDRRWKKIAGILRTSAYLNGRNSVDFTDCLLLEHLLWDKDSQTVSVRKEVEEAVSTHYAISFRDMQNKSLSSGGYLMTDDRECYCIGTPGEDLFIYAEDYDRLDTNNRHGIFGPGNRIRTVEGPGDLILRKDRSGTIIINNVIYHLRRRPAIQYQDMCSKLDKEISGNLFLRDGLNGYPDLACLMNRFKTVRE